MLKSIVTGVGAVVLVGVVAVLLAFPTMWAWNYLMPAVFGLKCITATQALVMNFLSATLFKSSSYKPE